MNSLEPNQNQYERYEFWVDEYGYLFQPTGGCLSVICNGTENSSAQLQFQDLFGDPRTFTLFSKIVEHVRENNSTITFPYRCDSDTCTYHYQALISKSKFKYVVFASNLLDRDERPGGVVWNKTFAGHNTHGNSRPVCSVCGKIGLDDAWFEFQQLVDDKRWPAEATEMQCHHDLCFFCENAVLQRIHDAEMHLDHVRECA